MANMLRMECRGRATVLRARTVNCRILASASAHRVSGSSQNSSTAISITATAAASALLAKVSALTAVGMAPGALLSLMNQGTATLKPADRTVYLPAGSHAFAGKVATAHAPAPTIDARGVALPRSWEVATSAAHWLELNRQATSAGVLLATVFISDKAARAHGPLLERMRAAHGTGSGAPVRFVYVHVGPSYDQRRRACSAAAAVARGSKAMSLDHLSYAAAHHGLDVALSALLPDGLRAFPSLMLTAGPAAADGVPNCAAAIRVAELTQLVADKAFLTKRRHAAAAAVTPATKVAVPAVPDAAVTSVVTEQLPAARVAASPLAGPWRSVGGTFARKSAVLVGA